MAEPLEFSVHPELGGFLSLLGLEPTRDEQGRRTFTMTVDDRHLRTFHIMHGGVACTLLDSALGHTATAVAPEGKLTVTAQLNINFVRPAWPGETLHVETTLLHQGRQTAVVRGELKTAAGDIVAAATGTFMYIPKPAGSSFDRLPNSSVPLSD